MIENFKSPVYNLIYVFRIPDEAHSGCLKIGKTTCAAEGADAFSLQPNHEILNKAAQDRIDQYTKTANIFYDLLHTELAAYTDEDGKIQGFTDTAVHNVLLRSGIKRKEFANIKKQGTEWFETDLETAKNAIKAVKEGRKSLTTAEISENISPIVFRPEQRAAIDRTERRFEKGRKMLWDAKMRFGKTLSALQVVKEMQFKRTLILTHRPVVDKGWYEDFGKIFLPPTDYLYGSKDQGEAFENMEKLCSEGKNHYIYFASMQDLRGSDTVGGNFKKNHEVLSNKWNLIIVDEAHEGIKTELGESVMKELIKSKSKVLFLSGTAYNLFEDFNEDEIYTWDYVMEQRAKKEWDETHFGDPNPYADMPKMQICTYSLGSLFDKYANSNYEFNFREFFMTDEDGNFTHRDDIESFLNLLVKKSNDSNYPFSTEEYRDIFRHTLWVVPGVKSAKALSAMLRAHTVFGNFDIVNVAGEGDDDVQIDNALRMVEKAIGDNPDETRTITLSCGRLTTGVTVKAWTGVMMLAGGYKTEPKAYMQTIFRVQSAATINGRVKENCYAFDFAPDRALQVIADVTSLPTKPGRATDKDKEAFKAFNEFCPVIAYDGSKMTDLDVDSVLEHLKKVYIERVVRTGFEDNSLYNDRLSTLSKIEVEEFVNLKGIIGKTKAMHNTGDIDINAQGMTGKEAEEMKALKKKNKKDLSEAEKKRLEELKKKQRVKDDAISILRGISIRMPLLIFGADIKDENKQLTIKNFTSLVDDQSWEEFMPKDVTKSLFNKFKKYYDPEIFTASGKRIREMTRAADRLTIEQRVERIASIFSTFRNTDKETVLTPWRVVNMHIGDTLGGYSFYDENYDNTIEKPRYIPQGAITDETLFPGTHLLEINSKTGLYPLYLAYSIYRKRLDEEIIKPETLQEHQRLWDSVVADNIFVICKTPMAKKITVRTLVGFRKAKVNAHYFEDLINQIKNKPDDFVNEVLKGSYWHKNDIDNMKFNAVVGNPPYQEEGISTRKSPIYHLFYDIAFRLSDRVTLITPARFLSKAGQTPDVWMDKILSDTHFKVIDYFSKSVDVFPDVEIKGGVAITLHDDHQDFGAIGLFSEHGELNSILQKVWSGQYTKQGRFSDIVSPQGLYKFDTSVFKDFPQVLEIQGKGTKAKITSKSLEKLPELFLDDKPVDEKKYMQMIGRANKERTVRWIKRSYVQSVDTLDYFKVLIPEASRAGNFGESLGMPIIGVPGMGHTDTFLSIGKFDNEKEVESCIKYIRSKFARTALGSLKVTQHNQSDTWNNVPLQDFTAASDIDWSKDMAEIDKQLYEKYGLTVEEINFTETMVKPM